MDKHRKARDPIVRDSPKTGAAAATSLDRNVIEHNTDFIQTHGVDYLEMCHSNVEDNRRY